jgi:hypothetical protein
MNVVANNGGLQIANVIADCQRKISSAVLGDQPSNTEECQRT